MAKRHEAELSEVMIRDAERPYMAVKIIHIVIAPDWGGPEASSVDQNVKVASTVPYDHLGALFRYLALRYAPRNTEDRKQRT
jgi:hypothetical protein